MDESLVSLVDETQNIDENNYIIDLNFSEDERKIYSMALFIIGLIINVIFIDIFNNSIFFNIFLNVIYLLSNCGILILTFKNKYYEIVKKNMILLILLLISILFDFILSLNNNENKLTLIFIFIIKSIIIGCYLKYNL